MKPNQHLVGKLHQDRYKKKKLLKDLKTKTLSVEKCSNEIELEEVITREAVGVLEKERISDGLNGSSLSTATSMYRLKVFE